MARDDSLLGRLDRLGVERLARARGLPEGLARRVAQVVVESGLAEDRRGEVFEELVAHFQDGLAAGQSADALLARFGEAGVVAGEIRRTKQTITPVSMGGTGPRDLLPRRLWRDIRYAGRRFKSRPLFTAIAVASLGVGIGANTAVFTLVNEVALRKQAFEKPEELVDVYAAWDESPFGTYSIPDYLDFARASEAMTGLTGTKMTVIPFERDGVANRLTVELVAGNYFEVLGLRPQAGRLLTPTDAAAPGQSPVVVLGERAWRRLFAGDPAVVGRTIRLRGSAYAVVGIAPSEYGGWLRGVPTDLYLPITLVDQIEGGGSFADRSSQATFLRGRLKAGATIAQARVEFDRVAADLRARREGMWQLGAVPVLIPTSDIIVYPPIDRIIKPLGAMLVVVVALVLMVACANLASFLLARAIDRRKEIAVRLALGATRGQLVSQLLVETVLLSMAGGALGLWLGQTALRAVLALDLPIPIPIWLGLPIDGRVVAFSVLVSVAAGVMFGLVPALQSSRLDLASVIRDEATGGGRGKGSVRNVLVGGQVAFSMVLMLVAGLLIRSLDTIRQVDPGFGSKPAGLVWLLVHDVDLSSTRAYLERVRQTAAATPGVRQVGLASNFHLNPLSNQSADVNVDGVEPPSGEPYHVIDRAAVDSGFFTAAGFRLLAGRLIESRDEDSVPKVAVVNAAFAEKFWPGLEAVGRRFRTEGREVEVVGVVNTAKIRSLAEAPRPFVYFPIWGTAGALWVVSEGQGDPEQLAVALGRSFGQDQRLTVMQQRSVGAHIGVTSGPIRMGATALIVFAGLGLAMACIGLYGAVSYAVAQRSREVGIRLSLGADRGSIVRLLLWGGLKIAVIGVAVGMPLAIGAGRLFERVLFGVRAVDPVTLVVAPALLLVVAGLAAYLPARRAGRVAPVAVLRAD